MSDRLRTEVLWLVLAVLAVDAIFAAIYFLVGVGSTSDKTKLAFTVLWTAVTLGVVLRGLSRVRQARLQRRTLSRS